MKTFIDVENAIYLKMTDVRPLFKGTYPDNYNAAAFTVINTLGVPADPIQTVEVNVNSYAKDLQIGIPDKSTLVTMANTVIGHLHNWNNDIFDIEYTFGNIIREQESNRHYFNARFKLIFINN